MSAANTGNTVEWQCDKQTNFPIKETFLVHWRLLGVWLTLPHYGMISCNAKRLCSGKYDPCYDDLPLPRGMQAGSIVTADNTGLTEYAH